MFEMERINQNEMMALAFGLRERGIEFEIHSFFDGLQIRCDGWDAICHNGSYGHERGLIEVMGLPQCGDDVIGYLTAAEVLAMVDDEWVDDEPADIDDDCGFDPYEGCYTYDCKVVGFCAARPRSGRQHFIQNILFVLVKITLDFLQKKLYN